MSYLQITLNIDLIDISLKLLSFLEKVDNLKYLSDTNVSQLAVRRYELFWLPLMSKYNGIITAPIDIYWVWYVHMLNPVAYKFDLESRFKKIIDHKFLDNHTYKSGLHKIKEMWENKYGEEEPFYLANFNQKVRFISKLSINLISAASKETEFYYNVSLPHFKSKCFLKQSLIRYKMYLIVQKMQTKQLNMTSYDINLMCHAHQSNPVIYLKDSYTWLDRIFSYHELCENGSTNFKMILSETLTSKAWKFNFQESYFNGGCRFRGEDSKNKLTTLSEAASTTCLTKTIDLMIQTQTTKIRKCRYKLEIYLCDPDNERCIYYYNYRTKKASKKNIFKFCSNKNTGFHLKIVQKKRFKTITLWETVLSKLREFDKLYKIDDELVKEFEIRLKDKLFDKLQVIFTQKYFILEAIISVGDFIMVSLNLKDQKTLNFLPNLVSDSNDDNGMMATHSVQTLSGEPAFEVNVIHILKSNQSIVQVYYKKKVYAMAFLIGQEQLPNRLQVEDYLKYPTINSSDSSHGFLIKDNIGDWMIIVPKWLEKKLGGNLATIRQPIQGFQLRIYHLRNGKTYIFKKLESKNEMIFEMENLFINITTGMITMKSDGDTIEIPNYICLSFVLPLLFIMSRPKTINIVDFGTTEISETDTEIYYKNLTMEYPITILGKPFQTKEIIKKKKSIIKKLTLKNTTSNYEYYKLFLASGILFDSLMPTNHSNSSRSVKKKKSKTEDTIKEVFNKYLKNNEDNINNNSNFNKKISISDKGLKENMVKNSKNGQSKYNNKANLQERNSKSNKVLKKDLDVYIDSDKEEPNIPDETNSFKKKSVFLDVINEDMDKRPENEEANIADEIYINKKNSNSLNIINEDIVESPKTEEINIPNDKKIQEPKSNKNKKVLKKDKIKNFKKEKD